MSAEQEPTSGNEPLKASDLDVDKTQKALDKQAQTEADAAEARLLPEDTEPASGSEDVERVGTEYSQGTESDPTGQLTRAAEVNRGGMASAGSRGDSARDAQVKHEKAGSGTKK
jgi:hypothetical protein